MKNYLQTIFADFGISLVGVAPCPSPDASIPFFRSYSVIVCLFPYPSTTYPNSNLAKYTYFSDYHLLIKAHLNLVGRHIGERYADFQYIAHTDTGPFDDRKLAYNAGLGFYGLNGCLINEAYGSWFLIGYLLTNHILPLDTPLNKSCRRCGKCIEACPGKAITADRGFEISRCKSYLTQKKGALNPAEIAIIKKTALVFGCDTCQDVCPHNTATTYNCLEEFRTDILHTIHYEDLADLSQKDFRRRYGNRAFSWRGKNILLRNLEYLQK